MTTVATRSCGACRRSEHARCTAVGCDCPICYPPDDDAPELGDGAPPPATGEILWEEPPSRGRPVETPATAEQIAVLRANPGRWARAKTFSGKTSATGVAKKVRAGAYPTIPSDEFDVQASRVPEGSALFLRARES